MKVIERFEEDVRVGRKMRIQKVTIKAEKEEEKEEEKKKKKRRRRREGRVDGRSYAKCESSDEFALCHLRCRLLFHLVRILSSGGSQSGVFHSATSALSPFDLRQASLFPISGVKGALVVSGFSDEFLQAVHKAEDRARVLRGRRRETWENEESVAEK